MRCICVASSVDTAAAGMLAFCVYPVCGDCMLYGPTVRMNAATAPHWLAHVPLQAVRGGGGERGAARRSAAQ